MIFDAYLLKLIMYLLSGAFEWHAYEGSSRCLEFFHWFIDNEGKFTAMRFAAEKAYYASHHRWRFELSFWHNDSRETLAQIQRFPAPKPIYIYFKAWNCKHYRSCRKVDIIVQTEHPSIKFLSRWQHAANLPLLVQPARLACFMGVLSSFPLSACLYLRKSGASRLWITHSSQHSIKYLQSRW